MNYNLSDLAKKQYELDSYIHSLHNVNYENTLQRRLLAFLVELGELANETRCFKFWSNKGPSSDEVVFEEYVDGIHFLLSLGNALKFDYNQDFIVFDSEDNLGDQFLNVYNLASNFDFRNDSFIVLFSSFLSLGLSLGLSKDKLYEVYLKKWQINIDRQNNNY